MFPRNHILIVDDQPDNLLILEDLLGAACAVHTANAGQEALDYLAAGGVADLILLDVVMPDLDGFEVCRRIKADPATREIPVIFLTALNSIEAEERGLSLGADDFIHKPFSPPVVLARVRNHLELSQTTRLLRRRGEDLERRVAERTAALQATNQQLRREISQREQTEDALHVSQENFHNIVQKNRTGILLIDEQGGILFANPAAENLLGRSSKELVGSQFGIPAVGGKTEINILRPSNHQGVAEMTMSETQWQGRTAYLLMLHDITEHKENEARIKHLAYHDNLTGLPNRALFADRFNQAILRARRNNTKVALLFMDLNRFKEVNDTFGHKTGDLLLKATATRISESVRKSDTVARMGGDEFTVLLEGLNSQEEAGELAQKIRRAFEQPVLTGARELFTTPSIGISIYPDHAGNTEALLRQADSAMYNAKRCKDLHICFYSEDIASPAADPLTLETGLRHALERQEFVLYYQIQVNLQSQQPVGMEALVRWRHPDRGLIFPTDFLALLEETGLILPVGAWILAEACRQASEWRQAGIKLAPIAVNVSPKQLLTRDQFVATVQGILADSGIEPGLLKLELTESAVIQEQARTLQTLRALRNLGVNLHMDDFGAGYSSLADLKHLPFDIVKIDQGFIADLLVDPDDALLTQAIVAMAHSLKKQVVAEGVETQEQAAFLRTIGCDYAQGWLYGRAMTAQDMTEYLRNPSDSP